MVNDSIADMLTRIRNAQTARHDSVSLETSIMKRSIAQILLDEGYISAFDEVDNGKNNKDLVISLKYVNKNQIKAGIENFQYRKISDEQVLNRKSQKIKEKGLFFVLRKPKEIISTFI